tara:strand:- start:455 stop:679 length:225 start_codon:yes stop_codon:yes gene_type:complete
MVNRLYYYSEKEWDRLGCGKLPPERNIEMTTFTSEDRIEAEKRQEVMFELQKRIKEPEQLELPLDNPNQEKKDT